MFPHSDVICEGSLSIYRYYLNDLSICTLLKLINDWQGALYRGFFFCNKALLASLALEQGRIDRVQFIIMMVHEKHPLVIHLVPSSPSFTKWKGAGKAALASFTGWPGWIVSRADWAADTVRQAAAQLGD